MDILRRLFMRGDRVHDAEHERQKDAEVGEVLANGAAARVRADRAIAAYRRADNEHRQAGAKAREAGEDLIDEVESRG